jgi:hypothetical protein
MTCDVFVCAAKQDIPRVRDLRAWLMQHGYTIIGETPAEPGTSMRQVSKRRSLIDQADVAVVVLSAHLLDDDNLVARADYNYALNDPEKEIVTLVYSHDAHLPMEAVLSDPISFVQDPTLAYERVRTRLEAVARRSRRRGMRQDLLDDELADAWRDQWQSRTIARIHTSWPPLFIFLFHVVEACWRVVLLACAYFVGWAYLAGVPGNLFNLKSDDRDTVVGWGFLVAALLCLVHLAFGLTTPYSNLSDRAIARRKLFYGTVAGMYLGAGICSLANLILDALVIRLGGPSIFSFHQSYTSNDMIPGLAIGLLVGGIVGRTINRKHVEDYFRSVVKDTDHAASQVAPQPPQPRPAAEATAPASPTATPAVWNQPIEALERRLFPSIDCYLSYEYADLPFARLLAVLLQRQGYRVYVDEHRLDDRTPARLRAQSALLGSAVVLVILSQKASASGLILIEYQLASRLGKLIIPIIAEQSEMPLGMDMLQRIDFSGNFNEAFQQLVSVMKGARLETRPTDERKFLRRFRNYLVYTMYRNSTPFMRSLLYLAEAGFRMLCGATVGAANVILLGFIIEDQALANSPLFVGFVLVVGLGYIIGCILFLFVPYHNETNRAIIRRRRFYDPSTKALVTLVMVPLFVASIISVIALLTGRSVDDITAVAPTDKQFWLLTIAFTDGAFLYGVIQAERKIRRIKAIFGAPSVPPGRWL